MTSDQFFAGRRPGKRGRGAADRTIVMVNERDGRIEAKVIPDARKETLPGVVLLAT